MWKVLLSAPLVKHYTTRICLSVTLSEAICSLSGRRNSSDCSMLVGLYKKEPRPCNSWMLSDWIIKSKQLSHIYVTCDFRTAPMGLQKEGCKYRSHMPTPISCNLG